MGRDKRKKGCPNKHCVNHLKGKKFSVDTDVCPECNSKLILVCKRCHCQIEDRGPKHMVCDRCDVIQHNKKQNIKRNAKKLIGAGASGLVLKFGAGANGVLGKQAAQLGGKAAGGLIKGIGHIIKR